MPDTKKDQLCLAPLDASVLEEEFLPFTKEIDQCFRQFGATLLSEDNHLDISGIDENNWSKIMSDLNLNIKIGDRVCRTPAIREFVANHVKRHLRPFPINKVRINSPFLDKSQYGWHQDHATWPGIAEQFPSLKGANVITFWISVTPSDPGNGIQFLKSYAPALPHGFVENQGYFSIDPSSLTAEAKQSQLKVFGQSYTAAIFSDQVLHRSLSGSQQTRLSFDIRYFYV